MELLTKDNLTLGAVVLTLLFMFGSQVIKNWFSTKNDISTENVKASAEKSLYDNLNAENNRMSAILAQVSTQQNVLMLDNAKLMGRVTELERTVHELREWEIEAKNLRQEVSRLANDIAFRDTKISQLEKERAECNCKKTGN